MERLYYQTINLEKLRAQVLGYSRELHPAMLLQSEDMPSERDALVAVYQHLQTLHLSMAKDLAELEILLALSSRTTVAVEQTENRRKRNHELKICSLSCKENEVLNMFAKGYSYCEAACEAAELLDCKLTTIQTHAKRIYKKLKVHSRSEAIFEARQIGLVRT